ncbi:MAG: CRISPR-associated endonuclease Cas2 [Candidatus Heimdallarchaeota archaeon]
MFFVISYDISHNSTRTKLIKICEAYGFERIQYSVFAGEQTMNMAETFTLEAKECLGKRLGKIIVIPICLKCFDKIINIGNQEELAKTNIRNKFGLRTEEKVMIV